MNRSRKFVLATVTLAAAVMVACPPWSSGNYGPLWEPAGRHIDFARLGLQIVALLLVGGVAFAFGRDDQRTRLAPGEPGIGGTPGCSSPN